MAAMAPGLEDTCFTRYYSTGTTPVLEVVLSLFTRSKLKMLEYTELLHSLYIVMNIEDGG